MECIEATAVLKSSISATATLALTANVVSIPSLTCSELNDDTTGLTITQRNFIQRVNTIRTGQTTSFRTGDDGDLEEGRGVDFMTLDCDNEFGNTVRFTNTIGTQDMSGIGGALVNYVIDHLTGLAWSRVTANNTWNNNIDAANSSISNGFSDWRLPNKDEITSIIRNTGPNKLNYAPFSIVSTTMDTSTTDPTTTTNRYVHFVVLGEITRRPKTLTATRMFVRNHY